MTTDSRGAADLDAEANTVLDRFFGVEPEHVEQITRPSVNVVWKVRTGQEVLALKRLGRRSSPQWLDFQHAAITRAAERGIAAPLPRATTAGTATADFAGAQWQLRPYVTGRFFADGDAADIRRAAACIARLHATPVADLPAPGPNPVQDVEHWLATDQSGLDDLRTAATVLAPLALWNDVEAAFRGAHHRARQELDTARWQRLPRTLTHGELAGSNLVFDGAGEISGLLDWDGVDIRPRVYDLARAALFLARNGRGTFAVHHDLAVSLLRAATADRPIEPGEIGALVPVLELYCVPTPRFLEQLTLHNPDAVEWYLGWAARGASTVRATFSPVLAELTT